MNDQYLTPAEVNAYIERAHQMRAEAMRDAFRALGEWVRGLFAGVGRHA